MFTWSAVTTPWDAVGYGAACLKLPSGRLVIGGASGDGTSSILYSDDGGTTWTPVSTPLDLGGINGLAYSQPLGRLVAVGNQSGGGPTTVAHSDDGGATWSDDGDPFAGASWGQCVAWDDSQALFVAGGFSVGPVGITSPDGLTWTPITTPFDGDGINPGYLSGIIYSASQGLWLGVGRDSTDAFTAMTSPDASAWSLATGPFDGTGGIARSIAEDTVNASFIAAGSGGGVAFATSPDFATWTLQSSPADGEDAQHVEARAGRSLAVVVGADSIFESPDGGVTWVNDPSSPLSSGYGICFIDDTHALAVGTFVGTTIAALGASTAATVPDPPALDSATPGFGSVALSWTPGPDGGSPITGYNVYRGTSSGTETLRASLGVVTTYNDPAATGLTYYYKVTAVNGVGESALSNELSATPLSPPAIRRRNPVIEARILVTDLNAVTTTWLDHAHLLSATITANLGLPWQIACSVRSGDRAVHSIFVAPSPPPDGDPLVAQSNRLVYVFLREAPIDDPSAPWVCRASGILMSPQDQGDSDIGTTHFVAYDPWQYCMGRPCYLDSMGAQIGPDGRLFPGTPGNEIAYTLIQDTIASEGIGIFADIPFAFGGTIYWDGTNETTPALDFKVQQGTSLGEALTQLASSGNDITGTSQCIDILFEPIYDPINRPGFVSQVSIYDLAGVERPEAPMAWARFTRSAKTADRQHDGTPGAFVNVVQFVAGQGVALDLAPVLTNFASVAKYRPYWLQQWFPAQPIAQAVEALAVQAVQLRKQGKRTFLVDPDPLRAGLPFRDYTIGDRIPVFASNALRVGSSGFQRIETIPVVIGPDGVTHVEQLLTSPDWPENEGS